MKKILASALAVTMLSVPTAAMAAESTMTLTATVPEAAYTMNIPADMKIPFGAYSTNIGNVTITESSGFADTKNVHVTVTYDGILRSKTVDTTIPFSLYYRFENSADETLLSGSNLVFLGKSDGSVYEYPQYNSKFTYDNLCVRISNSNWGKALAGDYSATLTFASEVVVEPNQ